MNIGISEYPRGDWHNNHQKFQKALDRIKYHGSMNETGIQQGLPQTFLPLLHYVLLDYSPDIAKTIADQGFQLNGISDQRFITTVWRVLREVLNLNAPLTPQRFLTKGYAETKIILMCEILRRIYAKKQTILAKKSRDRATWHLPIRETNGSLANDVSIQWHNANLDDSVRNEFQDSIPLPQPMPKTVRVMKENLFVQNVMSNQDASENNKNPVENEQEMNPSTRNAETESKLVSTIQQLMESVSRIDQRLADTTEILSSQLEQLGIRLSTVESKILNDKSASISIRNKTNEIRATQKSMPTSAWPPAKE